MLSSGYQHLSDDSEIFVKKNFLRRRPGVGVVLPPKEPGKKAFDGESFLRKSLKRKSPGLRSKINTCLKSAQGRSFLTSDNRLSHTDSIESFNRTLKELVCNVHARLPVPEPEEKEGTFFEYLNTEQRLVFKERRKVHRQVLNNRTDELVAARKRLNLKCNKLRKFAQNEMLESGLEGFQDKHVLGQTREAFKVLKETLRSVRLSWLERRSKGEVSNVKFQRHYENLFTNRPAGEKFVERSLPGADSGPLKGAEVLQALREINMGKAPGESQITSDLLKLLEKIVLKPLTRIFTDIWLDPGKVPKIWRDAVVLNLFKKGSRAEPNNYRSIFLLDQVGKVFAKVIANRVNKQLPKISPYQFGFRSHRSTGQAILAIRCLLQRRIENQQPLCMTFIDLKKAFDSIDREVLFIALRDFGIPGDIISLIEALHTKPIGKLDKDNTFVVNRGVRQGCVLGPLLFIILFDFLLSKTSGEKRNFAYADDLALISDNQANATKSLNEMAKTSGLAQLEISVEKTKSIVINTKDNTNVPINVLSEQVEQVNHFEYLGSIIASDGSADKAISARISKTRIAMLRLRPALVSKKLTLRNKGLLIETFLKPVLLYSLETLVIRCTDLGRLEAVIHRAKRMCLRLETRNEMKLKELNEKVKTTPVAHQLCRRRVKLYASFKNIGPIA